MDLKAMLKSLKENAIEAELAFHAGHQEVVDVLLKSTYEIIRNYFNQWTPPADDVTEGAAGVKTDQPLTEVQKQVSGPGVEPAVIDPEKQGQTQSESLGMSPVMQPVDPKKAAQREVGWAAGQKQEQQPADDPQS